MTHSKELGGKHVQVLEIERLSDILTDLKLQQQKLDFFKEHLELQDKRIDDRSDSLGTSVDFFGILITAIVVFISLRSTKEAVQAAKDEARKEIEAQAKNIIESWLGREGRQELTEKVENVLRPEIKIALDQIHEKANEEIKKLNEERLKAIKINDEGSQLNEEHRKLIKLIGSQVYRDNLGEMRQNAEAIDIYDEVVRRFGESTEASLRELVAKALRIKSIMLRKKELDKEKEYPI